MVNSIDSYKNLLQRGVAVYDQLIQIYTPDKKFNDDWVDKTLAETRTKRNALLERLANPRISATYTNTLILSIGQYLDSHWSDYALYPPGNSEGIGYPYYNLEKHQQVEQLHAELQDLINEVGSLVNTLH